MTTMDERMACVDAGGHFWPEDEPEDVPVACTRCGYNPNWNSGPTVNECSPAPDDLLGTWHDKATKDVLVVEEVFTGGAYVTGKLTRKNLGGKPYTHPHGLRTESLHRYYERPEHG